MISKAISLSLFAYITHNADAKKCYKLIKKKEQIIAEKREVTRPMKYE